MGRRQSFLFVVSLLVCSLITGTGELPGQGFKLQEGTQKFLESFGEAILIRESKPVRVKDVEFVAVAQTNWKAAKRQATFPMVARIEVQLRITNLSNTELMFPTQSFTIKLTTMDGKEITPRTTRKGNASTRPFVLSKDASYACWAGALLGHDGKNASELVQFDGKGSESTFGPLTPGKYKLAFAYSAKPPEKGTLGDVALWTGEVVTHEIVIEIDEKTTRGGAATPVVVKDLTEPIRIGESKPVTVNGAKFVFAAQTNWKPADFTSDDGRPGRGNLSAPIELQLRITNVSKGDLLFYTFDSLRVSMTNASGSNIQPNGGRDLTRFAPPIVIAAGTTYSLGREGYTGTATRQAQFVWDEDKMKSHFYFFDGTGTGLGFGPLRPAKYNLAFRYGVQPRKEESKAGELLRWSGQVTTEEIVVEVLKR
jgi:hypothetical protein